MKQTQAIEPPNKTGNKRVRVRLDTLIDLRRESAALYRLARGGSLTAGTARELAGILRIVGHFVVAGELEQRLCKLEEANSNERHV